MSFGCECGGACCHDESSGLGWLAAITADEAAQQAMPLSTIRSTPGFTQQVYNDIRQAAQTGQFQSFNPSGCMGQPTGGNIKLATTAATLALTGVEIGLVAAHVAMTVLGPLTMGIGTLIGLFGMFYAHHAAKVAMEQKVVCASVPAANNYLQVIDQAVRTGKVDPQHGISALQSLQSDFANQVAPIMHNDSSHCNAACVWTKQLEAIVAEMTSQYQDLAAQQAAAAAQPAPAPGTISVSRPNTVNALPGQITVAAPGSLPSWLPWAVVAAAGFFFLESM
jgi:hypothetical protein